MNISCHIHLNGAFEPGVFRQCGGKMLRPPAANPMAKHPIRETVFSSHQRPWNPIFSLHRSSCIQRLLTLCHPSAIFRTVASIHINSINCESFGIAIGVGPRHEWFKCRPILANFYTPAAIMFKAGCSRISASSLHHCPDLIKTSARQSVGCSSLISETPARNDASISQLSTWVHLFGSTGASAKPQSSSARPISGLSNDRQAAEYLSGDVFDVWMRHSGTLYIASKSIVGAYIAYIAGNVGQKVFMRDAP